MPDQRYDANRQTIGSLLSTTSPRVEVPEWQRSYAWGAEEIEAFWLDLLNFDGLYPGRNIQNEEYFLGSAVLVTGGNTNLLLDGQQRLATATILLSVLRDARRVFKADAATRLQNKFIADLDDATGETTPVLTLNVYDREYFRAEVQDERTGDQARPTATLKSHGLVRKARDYFAMKIAEEEQLVGGGKSGFERNLRISDVLCSHMSLVVIHSSDEDNAAAVFETLNDRGIGLSTPDLLRNLLLRRASGADARSRVVSAWQNVLGIADEASVDEFLRHFWVSKRGDVKARKLYREIKEAILIEDIDSVEFSLELADAAPIYRDLVRGRDSDKGLQRQLEGVRMLGAKVLLPALLSGHASLSEDESKGELQSLTSALTTLFVRHSVIGGRDSTTLESTVYSVAAELRRTGDFGAAVAALRAFAPDAEDFVSRFARASVSRIATARYLLREIEHAKRATSEVAVELADRVHVEHIYPQTPETDARWSVHAQMINRLGNMTLLGKRLNTSIKNADFSTKKEKGYEASDILLTKELLVHGTWSPAIVEARQKEMSELVFQIWSFPGEAPPSPQASDGPDVPKHDANDAQTLDELPEVPA
ncbi:DUF262 domain-containing protein [Nesterenkonia sandarakina]|uniref:DUF262 domain-containing protein n=1 Tax=Nesterenkonia sandarakina TaxID=272918 RepID=A0A7Z0J333_9MICC|nr:DUF262 domain-containing protein [Nesterenkonia sandarakina]NYJ16611.1 hypothetical protein [Nesterenkonia sandarakina]